MTGMQTWSAEMCAAYRPATATACSTACVDASEKSIGHKICLMVRMRFLPPPVK